MYLNTKYIDVFRYFSKYFLKYLQNIDLFSPLTFLTVILPNSLFPRFSGHSQKIGFFCLPTHRRDAHRKFFLMIPSKTKIFNKRRYMATLEGLRLT